MKGKEATDQWGFSIWQRDVGVIEGNHDVPDASMLAEDWVERDNDI